MEMTSLPVDRAATLRMMELNMLETGLSTMLETCGESQRRLGKGILVLKMNPHQADGVRTFWKAAAAGIPDAEFGEMARQADVSKGILAVCLVYPDRVSGYVLNLNTSPGWRAFTQRPFAIIEERVREAPQGVGTERVAQTPLRPQDLEEETEFL